MPTSRSTRIVLYVYGILMIFFLYLPLSVCGFRLGLEGAVSQLSNQALFD